MNISWYGQSCFKLQSKEVVLITDPFDKKTGLKPPFGAADIVTVSHDHSDHNNFQTLKNNPFLVDSAGEYEIKKVTVRGVESYHDNMNGKERGSNVIYVIEMEDITICHLGDLGQNSLQDKQLEKIGPIDILLIPIGGVSTIDWKESNNIISQIEPRIIIPMHYKIPEVAGDLLKLDDINNFAKEHRISPNDAIDKFNIRKKDLPQEKAQVTIMKIS